MRPKTLKFFQLHNPFYLLSALCMLVGCYGLVRTARVAAGHTETLLLLMGVLQVYELLLVGLAWYLISSKRDERYGRMLLLLELVFLVDTTYLNAEYSAADPNGGVLVGLLALVLVLFKVGVMFHALGLRFRLKAQACLMSQFGALFGIPLLSARLFRQDLLSEGFFYAVWWLVGALLLFHPWMVEELGRRRLRRDWLRPLERNFRIGLILLPFASVCWHTASTHWVYAFPFHASYLTPLILGLGVVLPRMGESRTSLAWRTRISVVCPVVALFFSVDFPDALLLELELASLPDVLFSPLRFALLAAAIFYGASYWHHRRKPFLAAFLAAAALAGAGHSVSSIGDGIIRLATRFLPRTAVELCMMSIVVAFVFLLLGAAVSLSHKQDGGEDTRLRPHPS